MECARVEGSATLGPHSRVLVRDHGRIRMGGTVSNDPSHCWGGNRWVDSVRRRGRWYPLGMIKLVDSPLGGTRRRWARPDHHSSGTDGLSICGEHFSKVGRTKGCYHCTRPEGNEGGVNSQHRGGSRTNGGDRRAGDEVDRVASVDQSILVEFDACVGWPESPNLKEMWSNTNLREGGHSAYHNRNFLGRNCRSAGRQSNGVARSSPSRFSMHWSLGY